MRFSIFVFLLLNSTAYAGWGDLVATPTEEITTINTPVELKIKFETDYHLGMMNPDAEGLKVKFTLGADGQTLGFSKTDEEGEAKIVFTPNSNGHFSIYAEVINPDYENEPTEIPLDVLDENTPVVITDIDGTISDMAEYLVPFYGEEAPTFSYAREFFSWISENSYIVYLTGRDNYLYHSTNEFLRFHNFPQGTLMMNDWKGISDLPIIRDQMLLGKFKTAVIRELQSKGLNVVLGIGNANTDAQAYVKTNIGCYIIESDEGIDYPCTIFKTYRNLKSLLQN